MPRRASRGPQAPPWSPAPEDQLFSLCHVPEEPVPRDVGWSLVLAPQPGLAEGTVPTRAPPAPVAAPQQGFGLAGGSRQLSAPGTFSLAGAHRLAGRMARCWLVLLPFLLTAGEDFAWWLAWVGGWCWRCFQPPTLVPHLLRAAGTPKTPLSPCRPRARHRGQGAGQGGSSMGAALENKCGLEVGGVG